MQSKAERERRGAERNRVDKADGMQKTRPSHTSAASHACVQHTDVDRRLPEASFLGLSVNPYIHTADKEKEEEKQREIIQFDSMQKHMYAKLTFGHSV